MDAVALLTALMTAIDERRWEDLSNYLHEEFSCRYVHTGETFDREAWVRLNAEYPGFDHLRVEEIVGHGDQAACRSHVTGASDVGLNHFECATFVLARSGLLIDMTEVWADVEQIPPEGTRPAA